MGQEVLALRKDPKSVARDQRMRDVRRVRDGEMQSVWPDLFSTEYPKAITANFIDAVARDLAEVVAPLPTLSCSSGAMRSEADKRRAERKNRIGEHYWRMSKLPVQMLYGADQYLTYGFLPAWIEPNFDTKRPQIHLLDPVGCYYRLDRLMNVRVFAHVWKETAANLAAQWPEYAQQIINPTAFGNGSDTEVECVQYVDSTHVVVYLPERNDLILASYEHNMSRPPIAIALRPGLHMEPRGQFDDVLFIQMARAVMAQLTLEAGHKAVQAPLAVPSDVTTLSLGPDAVIQSDNPEKIGRVRLEVPQAAFALGAELDDEMKIGARYPDARLGVQDASVITGKGVQALMGGFDTQIKGSQEVMARLLVEITELCFETDEVWFPGKIEKIQGTLSGHSYELTYTPKTDIAGNYSCDVTYGFASGMTPGNALVTMLQARGDGLIDRDTVRRQLPWGIDAEQVQRDLDVQETEDALKQGLFAALQSVGQMLAQGMTDQAMMFFTAADDVIKARENGRPVNEALMASFQAYQQKQQEAAAAAQQAQAATGGGGADGLQGVGPTGLPPNVAPGQAGLAPGGLPDVQSLVAGFRGDQATMSASVRKRLPTG